MPRSVGFLNLQWLAFAIVPTGVEERYRRGEAPREHALRHFEEKALAVAYRNPDA